MLPVFFGLTMKIILWGSYDSIWTNIENCVSQCYSRSLSVLSCPVSEFARHCYISLLSGENTKLSLVGLS